MSKSNRVIRASNGTFTNRAKQAANACELFRANEKNEFRLHTHGVNWKDDEGVQTLDEYLAGYYRGPIEGRDTETLRREAVHRGRLSEEMLQPDMLEAVERELAREQAEDEEFERLKLESRKYILGSD